jgi:hypothetical protein
VNPFYHFVWRRVELKVRCIDNAYSVPYFTRISTNFRVSYEKVRVGLFLRVASFAPSWLRYQVHIGSIGTAYVDNSKKIYGYISLYLYNIIQ